MKELYKYLYESILDDDLYEGILDDEDVFLDNMDRNYKYLIEKFIKDNYNYNYKSITISDKPNKYGKYEASSDGSVFVENYNITSLTNGLFVWNVVGGEFYCSYCNSLKSLEGAPKEVDGGFYCNGCKVQFTEDDVKKVSGVQREIFC